MAGHLRKLLKVKAFDLPFIHTRKMRKLKVRNPLAYKDKKFSAFSSYLYQPLFAKKKKKKALKGFHHAYRYDAETKKSNIHMDETSYS